MVMKVILAVLLTVVSAVSADSNGVRGADNTNSVIQVEERELQQFTAFGIDANLEVSLPESMAGDDGSSASGSILAVSPTASISNPLTIPNGQSALVSFDVTLQFGPDGGVGLFTFFAQGVATSTPGANTVALFGRQWGFRPGSAPPNFGPVSDAFRFRLTCSADGSEVRAQWLDFSGILRDPEPPLGFSGTFDPFVPSPAAITFNIGGFPANGFIRVECEGEDVDNSPEGGGGGNTGVVSGDPHFKTWKGHRFDYHGMCDMVMVHAPHFQHNLGFDLHIRTKLRKQFSYIESAALRFGTDILEITGNGVIHYNGERVHFHQFPLAVGSGNLLEVQHERPDAKHHAYKMDLSRLPRAAAVHGRILVKSYGPFVSVLVDVDDNDEAFSGALGLMGEFGTGRMVGRDGVTVMEDPVTFGEEWQVLESEAMLFVSEGEGPHHPQKCIMPITTAEERRRLSGVDRATAEKACAEWPEEDKEACIFDVMATGDLEMATAGAW